MTLDEARAALRRHASDEGFLGTLRPYHGQPLRDPAEVYRGQAKSGTSHFHAYATAYVVRHGRRSTVALAHKRSLAVGEIALGVEGLERFVRREPLRRVHECVFGVLALESEPVDPRL